MTEIRDTVRTVVRRANPAFVVGTVGVLVAVLAYALLLASAWQRRYLHMVLGILWTGSNVLLGVVVWPVAARLDVRSRARFYSHMAPKLAVLLPLLLVVVVVPGVPLALQFNLFPHADPWLALTTFVNVAGVLLVFGWRFTAWTDWRWLVPFVGGCLVALAWVSLTAPQFQMTAPAMLLTLLIGTLLTLTGLGVILSGNLCICHELQTGDPDASTIAAIGQQNAFLARFQAFLQLIIITSVAAAAINL